MKYAYMLLPAAALALSACSKTSEYSPAAGASGADIYKAACSECHAMEDGKIFELSKEMASADAISTKISGGGMMMPSFPDIQGEALSSVAEYVLANSKAE